MSMRFASYARGGFCAEHRGPPFWGERVIHSFLGSRDSRRGYAGAGAAAGGAEPVEGKGLSWETG